MFGWMSKCWASVGISSQFEKARLRAVFPDWKSPQSSDVEFLLRSFQGDNPEVQESTAINMFFSHLERDNDIKCPPFMLKHILIMDRMVDEGIKLETISHYYNSQLLYSKQSQASGLLVKQLIGSYYIYVKDKAKLYLNKPRQLFDKKTRKAFLQKKNSSQLFAEIDCSLQIQKSIQSINQKFKNGKKQQKLIQQIFVGLLKSYLFSYSVISYGIMMMFDKIDHLAKHDLRNFWKLVQFINKDFTRNFFDFISMNNTIEGFKQFSLKEIYKVEDKYIRIIENIMNTQVEPQSQLLARTTQIPRQYNFDQIIVQFPVELVDEIIVKHNPRLKIDLQKQDQNVFPEDFQLYENFYNQYFIEEQQTDQQLQQAVLTNSMKRSKLIPMIQKVEKVKQQTEQSKIDNSAIQKFKQFEVGAWNKWKNIYSC